MSQLKPELQQQIVKDAEESALRQDYRYPSDNWSPAEAAAQEHKSGYELGATEYAIKAQRLVEALEGAVKQWQDRYNAECDQADWFNNNMPGVGQTFDYKSRPVIPEWINAATSALSSWNEGKDYVRLNCMGCGKDFYGPEPKMCCDGRECGCMGQPTEPVVCSQECYDKAVNQEGKEGKV